MPPVECHPAVTAASRRHYSGREMPGFLILFCKVERFISRRAAAPSGLPPL